MGDRVVVDRAGREEAPNRHVEESLRESVGGGGG